jgi:putative hydrolase of the HAD superfamily
VSTARASVTTVVWDFGGVLFHWQPGALVREHGLGDPAESDASLATRFFAGFGGDWAEFDRGSLGREAVVASIAQRTGWQATAVGAVVDAVPRVLRVDADTLAIADLLAEGGLTNVYLSNMPAPYADELERGHTWIQRFAGGVFSSRIGMVKPEPAIFALAEKRFGASAHQLVFIDDAPANIDAARAAGWQAVLYRDARTLRADLQALGLMPVS